MKPLSFNFSSKRKGILFVGFSTIIIAFAQVFLKKGSQTLALTLDGLLFNYWLILGIIFYALATGLFVIGLKYGKLSTLYPVLGLGYIWVCILAYFIFKEMLTLLDLSGIALIIIGIYILGAKQDE
jgi:drug/metabolite transporter (DMT)-like permease